MTVETPGAASTPTDAASDRAAELDTVDWRQRAGAVRRAQRSLGSADGEVRSQLLATLADVLQEWRRRILAANQRDLENAQLESLASPLLGRLALDSDKLAQLTEAVRGLARQPDPIGRRLRHTELDDGLVLECVQSAIGVLLIIFESRPDAVVQIGSLALRTGNGVLMKGGSEARESNRVLVDCLREALRRTGLDPEAICMVDDRGGVHELLGCDQDIDLVIPRGSADLVRRIQSSTRIPVLGHADGVCHIFVDRHADPAKVGRIVEDSKCSYPAACNAVETLLVHRGYLPELGALGERLRGRGVELRADAEAAAALPGAVAACADDWHAEYLDLVLAIRTVDGLDQAIEHIHRYGSAHTEVILTEDVDLAEEFLRRVDAASVFSNASTRFADGYRYGLGAEVGISTGRIHARGPVGADGLLTSRWLLRGSGQSADQYGPGGLSFRHRSLPL